MKSFITTLFFAILTSPPAFSLEWDTRIPATFKIFMENTLHELYTMEGRQNSPLHQAIFQGPSHGKTYQKWLNKRIQKISLSTNCNVAAHIDSEGPPGILYISKCSNLNPTSDDKAYWLSIFIHEARHLESHQQFWKHSVCTDDFGSIMACDHSPLGAFGAEKVWAKNLLMSCHNCSPEILTQLEKIYEDQTVWNKLMPPAQSQLRSDAK